MYECINSPQQMSSDIFGQWDISNTNGWVNNYSRPISSLNGPNGPWLLTRSLSNRERQPWLFTVTGKKAPRFDSMFVLAHTLFIIQSNSD